MFDRNLLQKSNFEGLLAMSQTIQQWQGGQADLVQIHSLILKNAKELEKRRARVQKSSVHRKSQVFIRNHFFEPTTWISHRILQMEPVFVR